MAAPTNYSELQAEIANWLNRDDLTEEIKTFIAFAENMFNDVLLVPQREQVSEAITSAATVELPEDFYGIQSIYLDANPKAVLEPVSMFELRSMYSSSATGVPRHYAIQSGNQLVFGPSPGGEVTIVLNYWQRIEPLSDALTTNWLLTRRPDIYLYGALMEASVMLIDDNRVPLWAGMLASKMQELSRAGRRQTWGASPLVQRIARGRVD